MQSLLVGLWIFYLQINIQKYIFIMIRDLIIRIINHLSVEVHPDAEWF